MKQLTTATKIIGAVLILALIAGCQTVSTNQAELAASKKEFLLARAVGLQGHNGYHSQATTGYQWSSPV